MKRNASLFGLRIYAWMSFYTPRARQQRACLGDAPEVGECFERYGG
jgi:hypothetical protein